MKRIFSLILAIVVLTLSSCEGVYTPPVTPEAETCPPHRDLDKSGICDKCGAVVELPGGTEDGGADEPFTVKLASGELVEHKMRWFDESMYGDVSLRFSKFEIPFRYHRIIKDGFIGDAPAQLCSARDIYRVLKIGRHV